MKSGWQTKKLGELCQIELGKTPARANKAFWDEGRQTSNVWLSIADLLNAKDNVVVDSKEYISDRGASISKTVPEGTLLVSFKLTLGRLAFAGRDLFTNEAIAALTIFNECELSKEFLFWFLRSFDWRKAAENDVKLKGMTLNKAKLREMPVHFPPPPEQLRIVDVLEEAFTAIAAARANTEQNLRNAREVFESHLDGVFSQLGEGSAVRPLGDLCRVRTGKKDVNQGNPDGAYPFFTCAARHTYSDTYSFETEALLVAGNGNVGQVSYYSGKFEAYQRTYVLSDFNLASAKYLFRVLDTRLSAVVSKQKLGNTMPYIKLGMLTSFPVPVPSKQEQQRIAAELDAISAETDRLASLYQRKFAALDALKQSLLHQAFTGAL